MFGSQQDRCLSGPQQMCVVTLVLSQAERGEQYTVLGAFILTCGNNRWSPLGGGVTVSAVLKRCLNEVLQDML